MFAKREVLSYIATHGPASSADLVDALDYATQAGAAATLLRLHRHGHLRRERRGAAYLYAISHKGLGWLSYVGGGRSTRYGREIGFPSR
jgi:predicted transcriptional regulator